MFDWFKYRPFNTGVLPEKDGYEIFFQQLGNPNGTPVLVFNGGPGFANDPNRIRYLDLKKQHLIIFDQRGTGGSVHKTGDVTYKNTTDDILDDAKRLIDYLEIGQKIVSAGTSWGATLALLFAQKYPEVVAKIISIATFTASKKYSTNWFEHGARLFYPDIISLLRENAGTEDFSKIYNELLFSDDENKVKQAVIFYGSYECMLGEKNPKFDLNREIMPWEINRLKIAMHYDCNDYFIVPNHLLKNIAQIQEIPLLMLHNRMDFVCPVEQAWDIHHLHPNSELHIYPAAGHGERVMGKFPKKIIQQFLKEF